MPDLENFFTDTYQQYITDRFGFVSKPNQVFL